MHLDADRWLHWWAVHLRWYLGDARLLLGRTGQAFAADRCTQLAAAIAYYVLVSIFPLAILLVSISGLLLTDDRLRADVVDEIFLALPLSEDEGRDNLESAVEGIATGFSLIGLVAILGLVWSATAMMGSIRHALNQVWGVPHRYPFLKAKLLDLTLVFSVGLLISASVSATVLLQVARNLSDGLSDALGPLGVGAGGAVEVVAILVPLLISFGTFAALYKYVPRVGTHFRHVWPGALLAAVLFELLKNGFAIYLRFFGDYDAIYGSLGAVVIFLFFVYLSGVAMLIGAEMAAEWPRVLHGHYDAELARLGLVPRAPWYRRALAAVAGLVSSAAPTPAHVDDADARARRLRREADAARGRADAPEPPDPTDPPDPDRPPPG